MKKASLKYLRDVPSTKIDVYDVLNAFDVRCPAIQHAIKKLLAPGIRGKGDTRSDLTDAYDSIERAISMEEYRARKVPVRKVRKRIRSHKKRSAKRPVSKMRTRGEQARLRILDATARLPPQEKRRERVS